MQYYTNVSRKGNKLYVRGKDALGKRALKVVWYKPTLYVPSPTNEGKFKNLKNQFVQEVPCDSMWDAKQFIERYEAIQDYSIYGFDKYEYSYIAENFPSFDYKIEHINVGNIDIETLQGDKAFPETDDQKRKTTITVISIQKGEKTYVLSWKDFINDDPNVVFFLCDDEKDMLSKFMRLWEKLDLDIITGWNIDTFDIPMIILRIEELFGWQTALCLSPWKRIRRREHKEFVGGEYKTYVDWIIEGIANLDYMRVYKKFAIGQRDSYSLNNISYYELGETKVDTSHYRNLDELWEANPQLYIKYNIHDTRLVHNLEKKLKYIERSIVVAYDAKVNYEDALSSVLLWECICLNKLIPKNIVMPLPKKAERAELKGAFVKDPQVGMFEWVVSFDLTSLYPHIMIGWNISPETLRGVLDLDDEKILAGRFNAQTLKDKNYGLAGNGALYDNSIRGFLADVIEEQFALRKSYKNKMLELEREYERTKDKSLKDEITKYDNYQYGKKIQLNSCYGAVANPFFKFYNIDNARAVTYTGQAVIKFIADRINKFLNAKFHTDTDYIIASDTDSVYIKLGNFVLSSGLTDRTEIIDALDAFCNGELANLIKESFVEFTGNLNAYKNALHMKRESICEKALWRKKKNYAAWVWDQEGVRFKTPKLKITGLEAVRSNTPEICRKKIKQGLELMFSDGEDAVQKMIAEFREEYMNLPLFEIGRPTSVKDYTKYEDKNFTWKPKAPKAVKAAILYNKFLADKNLHSKYRKFHNGDKIKYLHLVKFNPLQQEVIGAPDGAFPEELAIDAYVDRQDMFETTFLNPMKSLLDLAGWSTQKQHSIEDFF